MSQQTAHKRTYESTSEEHSTEGCPWLVTPAMDITPELSIILPTLNEQRGIGPCLEQIEVALTEMESYGEVIVADSSDDYTPDIARLHGARVIHPDQEGYGAAYQCAYAVAEGTYLAMGDADTTYDFTELPKLCELVCDGDADMAMGSRLDGTIKRGAMPALHKYIGNPLLTRFLNLFYDAGVSDAHSGMRVFSRDAWDEMECSTTGMEFASEMIMEAGANNLEIEEEPITYYEREGEASLESFPDGWRHVRFMLLNAPGYLFSIPGMVMFVAGVALMFTSMFDISILWGNLGTRSLLMSAMATLIGFQITNFGVFATVASDPIKRPTDPYTTWLIERLTLERGLAIGALLVLGGGSYVIATLSRWVTTGFAALPSLSTNIFAVVVMVLGVQLLFGSFLLSCVAMD